MGAGKPAAEMALDLILYSAAVLTIALLYGDNLPVTVIMLILSALILTYWRREQDTEYFIYGAVLGTAAELIGVKSGAWGYANPSTWGIPAWLPVAWGLVVVLIRRLTLLSQDIRSKDRAAPT